MLNETDLEEFYEILERKKKAYEKQPNHWLDQQIRLLRHLIQFQLLLIKMYDVPNKPDGNNRPR